uniref:SLC26A/SulP transporter domain-containing protein n=1 Tax=Timema bartmani TaxID=61472 RepID=A0A7R9F7X9_9NEOP|nr:unnamed protein product [Timema bartmani]
MVWRTLQFFITRHIISSSSSNPDLPVIDNLTKRGWRREPWAHRTPGRDSSLDLTVNGSLVYCETSALDYVATEAGIYMLRLCNIVSKILGHNSNGSVAVSLPPPADPSNPRDGEKSAWYSRANHDERMRRVIDRARRGCTKKLLYKRIPVLTWLPQYNLSVAASDLVAGFTVGLTVIPQAIAYANVAGLPPQYGLYSSFMACFVYTIFGSCKDSPVGPTAIAAILTRENLHGLGPEFAVLMCFLCGCVVMLMGILQLGFLIDFISGPVSVGFTSAAAIIIATTQIKDLLGLSFPGSKFLDVWEQLFEHISETRLWDTLLGFACMAILLLLRKAKDIPVGPADTNKRTTLQKVLGQMLWLISTGRNILVVVVCAVMAYTFKLHDVEPFLLTGYVKPGLPPFQPPPFMATVGNTTYSFLDMTSSLGSALFVVPLLAILEDVALAKVFSDGRAIDATQEMLAIGACNILSSFVSSMPVSGALSRGAVNHASGVATTFGGIYTGILVILSLYLFTPYFAYIPKASLAAVIVAAVVFMVEFHVVKPMWRTKITYTTETWTLNVREIRKVEAMRMKFMRRMLTVTRRNRIRNEVILEIVIWTSNEYVKGENTKENIEVEVWREKTANETREEMGGADNNKFVKLDLIPAIATFLSCLFIRLELGIVIGIGINILFLLYASARPSVHVEKVTSSSGCEYLLITPDRSLVFPSVEYVRNLVTKAGMKEGSSCTPVVIDSRHIQGADFTAAKGIKSLIEDFVKRNQPILFYNLKPSVVEVFQGVQPKEFKHCHNEAELNELLKEVKEGFGDQINLCRDRGLNPGPSAQKSDTSALMHWSRAWALQSTAQEFSEIKGALEQGMGFTVHSPRIFRD